MLRREAPLLFAALLALLALAGPASAAGPKYREPALGIPTAKLAAAFECHGEVGKGKPAPVLLVSGTGSTGDEVYLITRPAFEALGRPVCEVEFPERTTADIQVSVKYLVFGIRRASKLAGRPISILGISQGGLLPRVALTYWPSLRPLVSDVVAAAGTQHGSALAKGRCSAAVPCPPALWQQAAGSGLLRALNSQPYEAPGPTAWTTVRSASDESVQPQLGKHPTSSLKGASNILIQAVCPERTTNHIGTLVDSVTFAALADAISHRGAAKVARLPADVCAHPYATGLSETATSWLLGIAAGSIGDPGEAAAGLPAEPPVRAWMKRHPPA